MVSIKSDQPKNKKRFLTFELIHVEVVGDVDVGVFEVSNQFVNFDLLNSDGRNCKFFRPVQRESSLPQGVQFHHTLEDHVERRVAKSSLVVFQDGGDYQRHMAVNEENKS